MLRLNYAMKQCGVAQAELVKATGYSKALISRALSRGELPVDLERFTGAVMFFVEERAEIKGWLEERGLMPESLLDVVDGNGGLLSLHTDRKKPVELDGALLAVAGRAHLQGASVADTMSLTRTALFLLGRLRELPIGMDELGEIEVQAGKVLLAGVEA